MGLTFLGRRGWTGRKSPSIDGPAMADWRVVQLTATRKMIMSGQDVSADGSLLGEKLSTGRFLAALWRLFGSATQTALIFPEPAPMQTELPGEGVGGSDDDDAAAEAGDAVTWAGVASRAVDAACEGWGKLARVCILLVFLALVAIPGSAWWWFLVRGR